MVRSDDEMPVGVAASKDGSVSQGRTAAVARAGRRSACLTGPVWLPSSVRVAVRFRGVSRGFDVAGDDGGDQVGVDLQSPHHVVVVAGLGVHQ